MKGEKALVKLAPQLDVQPNQIAIWRGQLLEGAARVLGLNGYSEPAQPAIDVNTLYAKIGELTLMKDFCLVRSERRDGFAKVGEPPCRARQHAVIPPDG